MLFKEIKKEIVDKYKITCDQIMILELLLLKEYTELESYYQVLKKDFQLQIQNLYRRNFIELFDINNQNFFDINNLFLSSKGEKIMEILSSIKPDHTVKITNVEKQFEEFWDKFPSTDKWENFPATRSLRQDKETTRKRFIKLLEEGIDSKDIIKGLEYQIELFKKNSKMNDNKMTFFQNSSTWLNQKTYLQYLEIGKEDSIEDTTLEIKL